MLKEIRGIDYTLTIISILSKGGEYDSKRLHTAINSKDVSLTYLQKILPRLVKCGILISSTNGYMIARKCDKIMISQLLSLCDMPEENSPSYKLCTMMKKVCENIPISAIT